MNSVRTNGESHMAFVYKQMHIHMAFRGSLRKGIKRPLRGHENRHLFINKGHLAVTEIFSRDSGAYGSRTK